MSSRSARGSCSPKARGRDCPPAPHPKPPSLAYGRSLVMTQASTLEQVVRDRLDEMADEELVPLRPFEVLPTSTTSRLVP
jgi:hypothetical protein